jgi:hypothetical protein
MSQAEAELEKNLVARLTGLGYEAVTIGDQQGLLANLKAQLEKHNKVQLSIAEFKKVVNHLTKGNVFDKAKTLRDRFQLTRDDGSVLYLQFLNTDEWCRLQESNPRPTDYKSVALPAELSRPRDLCSETKRRGQRTFCAVQNFFHRV